MKIEYFKPKTNTLTIKTDTERMIREHRDDKNNRKNIENYRYNHPTCERCRSNGEITATKEIHHIEEVVNGGSSQSDNLLALCHECHITINELTKDEQRELKWKKGYGY